MNGEPKRQQTKQMLLDATKALVKEKGCSKMTLNDIMEQTGLSKGAIYHYVKSKDELLALILLERIEDMNSRFFAVVENGNKGFEKPLEQIINSLPSLQDPHDATNQIFNYLLGKNDQPRVKEVILQFHEQAIERSKQWILSGQKNGVIPLTVDADKIAELFILISYGIRMRSTISPNKHSFGTDDFSSLIAHLLGSKK
ncbi:AcrR family transcriptional regulator [Bacillus pakistanensis]|uniref:AcrR family transcriptional regulator n=1 Tax=Rossellomorea pakistanensis TaxID=992288 RepID=A0ABS2N7A3_9BACI|nr:TetR/AcrR family transcriptional regulator [Bacillus pakistanensis]MBM7583722.1 AcrR family transcriptional regulator [Bacillus pakistanensis]